MKKLCCYLLFMQILFLGCSKQESDTNLDTNYIRDIEVLSHKVADVKINNFTKTVTFLFERGLDLSEVEIKLTLADHVEMVSPPTPTANYNLTGNVEIQLKRNGKIVTFHVQVHYMSEPLVISSFYWVKKDNFGNLPEYISVYKYKKDISGKLVQAYIAVADISEGSGKLKILGEKKGYKTPSKFYADHHNPKVLLNGGYFWSGTSLGLMIKNEETISHAQPTVNRPYDGVPTPYFPTQGAFGLENDGRCTAQWVYESNHTLYAYPNPSPNVAGEMPQPRPYSDFPAGGVEWQPKEAIGAGPLLIKKGEYKNLWINELFDEASGVGPNSNHPRSAIGYHPNGYVVLFVCEGRNKTPHTPGMTFKNIADILLGLGCTEAINLDGGGSSCLLVNGQETIIPSDGAQRPIPNMVAIY